MHDGYYGYGNISPVYVARRLLGIMRDVIDWLADFFYPVEFRNHKGGSNAMKSDGFKTCERCAGRGEITETILPGEGEK